MSRKSPHPSGAPLVLSLFPGIDLLGRAFEAQGMCVVGGPDKILGGDVRDFHAPAGRFDGVIGGPPCQDFSTLNRRPGQYGHKMTEEWIRLVLEAQPDWFLYENVSTAPRFVIPGYTQQRFDLDLAWFSEYSRRRIFVFGSKSGARLDPMKGSKGEVAGGCVTGSDERSFSACCEIQGLPPDFDLPFFSLEGKKQAVANAVPLALGGYVAELISAAVYGSASERPQGPPERSCACECGRRVLGRALYASAACRKRAQRVRDREA